MISGSIDPAAKIIFGAYHDKKLKDNKIKVTVIATGFNGSTFGGSPKFEIPSLFGKSDEKKDRFLEDFYKEEEKAVVKETRKQDQKDEKSEIYSKKKEEKKEDSSSWDIPAFLRRKKK